MLLALAVYQNHTGELWKNIDVRIHPQDSDSIGFKWSINMGILKRLSSNSSCSQDRNLLEHIIDI